MRKFNLVKSLSTRVVNIVPSLRGLGCSRFREKPTHGKRASLRMLILCLSLAVFGVDGAWGQTYVLNSPTENSVGINESKEYTLSGPGAQLTFDAKRTAKGIGNLKIAQYINGSWSSPIFDQNPGTVEKKILGIESQVGYASYGPFSIDSRATKIKFYTVVGASLFKYFKNIKVTMAQYLENPSVSSLDCGSGIVGSSSTSNTVTVAWCNVPGMTYQISGTNANLFSVSLNVNAEYGKYNTSTFTITYEHSTVGKHSATLTISDFYNGYSQTVTLSGTTTRKTAEITWEEGTTLMNVDEYLENPASSTNGTLDVKYTSSDPSVIEVLEGGVLHALKYSATPVTITAYQEESGDWARVEKQQTITVTNKTKQSIDWDEKLSFEYSGSPYTYQLSASAATSITYSIATDGGSVASVTGNTLTIKGLGKTTITATAAETDEYVGVSAARRLTVRDPNAACDDPFYEEPNEHSFTAADGKSWETPTFIYEPHTVSFQAYKTMATAVGSLYVYEYVNNSWKEIKEIGVGSLDKNSYKDFGPYELSRGATKVKIGTKAGSYTRYIRNIEVTLSKYLESATTELNFTAEAGAKAPQQTFYISYSNIQGPISISCTDTKGIFSFPDEIDAECGDVKKNVPVTVDMLAQSSGSISETLTLTDGKGQSISVALKATVSKLKQSIEWEDEVNYKTTDSPVLTAKSSTLRDDMPVTYRSGDETIALVNGSKVTFLKAGDVTIYANQAGNTYYDAAPEVSKVFHVSKVTPTIVTMPSVVNGTITYGSKLSDVDLTGGSAKDDKNNAVAGHFVWVNPDEVPHGGQQNYTVRFVPNNTNMYTSDAVSTETLTITVNKANQTLTWDVDDPIKVKKEDGDYTLTASSTSGRTITYTLSNPSLGTINGNKLTPLKSGECAITAVCPADGDYNESNSIEKNLLIAGPDEIVWKYKEGDHVWAGQNLNAKGDLATAHTTVYFGTDQTQWYLEVDNNTNPKTVYTTNASDDVLVTISASTSGDDYYASVSSSIQVYIDRCYQGLVWDQNFLNYLADEQGQINKTIDLTAMAVDSLNKATNLPIVYSVDNTAVAEITGNATNGWKLHIKGAGEATLTASVAQTNIYQGVTETRKINVRKVGEPCGSYALISTGEKKISDINDDTYTFNVPGETLTFKTRKYSILTLNADVTIEGWNIKENAWQNIGSYTLDFTSNQTKTYSLNENIRKIRMSTNSTIENNYRYISDLYITQKEYIRSSVEKIEEKIYINQEFSKTFTVDYSDKPYISCTIDNDQLEILRDDDSNTCGESGTITFTVKGKNIWLTTATVSGNITLSTSVGDAITIPVQVIVDLGGTYQFTNKSGDNDWNNLQNWDYGGSVPTSLPDIMNPVEILQPIRIDTEVKVYGLKVETDAMQDLDGSITIAPTGGLTVYNGGVSGLNNKLTIESSREHTGYFRVIPNVVQTWVATPTATMQYASKGSLDTGADKDATWQYFGIPVNGADFTVDYITWLYEWSEPNGWIDLKNANQPVRLKPFQGYAITQYGQPTYNFTGQLNMGKVDLKLTYTDGNGMWGDNMFANSFPSPIDVKLFTEEDFVDLDYKTIYLYNSGSWNDWNNTTQGGDWDHLTDNAGAPGTFTAIPALAAPYLETEQTLIAPMQGMCIHTDNTNGATVHLNYAKHVWDAMPAGSKDDMNAPLLTPARKASADKPEGISDEVWEEVQYAQFRRDSIAEAHKQKVAELRHRVRLTVYGENSGVDHIYLLEKDGFTTDYDNGYDAYKMFNDGPLNLYTNEDFGQMAVSARNSIDSTYIGIEAGEDDVYQLIVSSVIGDSLLLFDTETSEIFALTDSAVYTFYAVPNQTNDFRFRIIDFGKRTHEQGHDTPTSWQDINGTNVHIWYAKHKLYITDAKKNSLAHIYTANGTLVSTISFDNATSINVENLAAGVYIVHVDNTVYRFVTL